MSAAELIVPAVAPAAESQNQLEVQQPVEVTAETECAAATVGQMVMFAEAGSAVQVIVAETDAQAQTAVTLLHYLTQAEFALQSVVAQMAFVFH